MIESDGNALRNITSTQLQALSTAVECISWNTTSMCSDAIAQCSSAGVPYFELVDSDQNWIYYPQGIIHCVPGTLYSWGFSPGYLWITSAVSSVWALGMFAIWCDSLHNGSLWKSGRALGDFRNILDIARVLDKHLGSDTCAYDNTEIARRVDAIPPVGFEVVSDGTNGYIGLSESPGGSSALLEETPGVHFGCRSRVSEPSLR